MPVLKFSINTSQDLRSSNINSLPSFFVKSIAIDFLFLFTLMKYEAMSLIKGGPQPLTSSPIFDSTLITLAP